MHSQKTDEAGVRAATRAWVDAFNAGDLAKTCAQYHPDAVLWGTTAQALITTEEGLHQYFEGHCLAASPPTISLGAHRIRVYAGMAINTGSYTLHTRVDGVKRALPARFSFTYCRVGSDWLIVDHHSSFVPASGPPS